MACAPPFSVCPRVPTARHASPQDDLMMCGGTPVDAWRSLQVWAYRLGVLLSRWAARATTQDALPPVRSGLLGGISPLARRLTSALGAPVCPPGLQDAARRHTWLTHPDTHGFGVEVRGMGV